MSKLKQSKIIFAHANHYQELHDRQMTRYCKEINAVGPRSVVDQAAIHYNTLTKVYTKTELWQQHLPEGHLPNTNAEIFTFLHHHVPQNEIYQMVAAMLIADKDRSVPTNWLLRDVPNCVCGDAGMLVR